MNRNAKGGIRENVVENILKEKMNKDLAVVYECLGVLVNLSLGHLI